MKTGTLSKAAMRGLKNANIPLRFQSWNFGNAAAYDDDTDSTVRGWIDMVLRGEVIMSGSEACGLGMLLEGEPGVGKSLLSAMILRELVAKATPAVWDPTELRAVHSPCLFISYPKLLATVKTGWTDPDAQQSVDRMFGMRSSRENLRLLVIDDLGKEHRTGSRWAEDMFDHLLRQRFDEGLPTIVTTNVPSRDWEVVYGPAMASFANEAFIALRVTSPVGDRRAMLGA